jgi:hypothetical protein
MRPVDEEPDSPWRVVWLDRTRADWPKERDIRLGDLVRYEFPGGGHEYVWTDRTGGIDAQFYPCPGLLYRLLRVSQEGDVPRFACELPVDGGGDGDKPGSFWRYRGKTLLQVPLVFVARPAPDGRKVWLDPRHKDLSVSYLRSPYDGAVCLSSPECLVLTRVRVVVRKEWLALELRLYNLLGPALYPPAAPVVRIDGGEQLSDLPPEQADKLLPDNPSAGEFEVVGEEKKFETGVRGGTGLLSVGASFGYCKTEVKGKVSKSSSVHPLRWELFTSVWKKEGELSEGCWRSGLLLYNRPANDDFSCTVMLKTSANEPFASLEYKGFLRDGDKFDMPGSAARHLRYRQVGPPSGN